MGMRVDNLDGMKLRLRLWYYSFRSFFKKEGREGLRTYRFLIIALGILFFSLADPVLIKLLPILLEGQFAGLDVTAMMDLSQRGVLVSHFDNLHQISTFIMVIVLMGIVASEKADKTLILPLAMGVRPSAVILAKWASYSWVLMVVTVLGVSICYGYSGILFDEFVIGYGEVLKASLLQGVFYVYVLTLLIALSTWVKKPFLAGLSTLLAVFALPLTGMIWPEISFYLPNQLLVEARYFSLLPSIELQIAGVWTVIWVMCLLVASCVKLAQDEVI
jgi:ABC-2 type transport system permease protein